jgi:1-acyl-sn-glycerol-3-phosphate acyltransferase
LNKYLLEIQYNNINSDINNNYIKCPDCKRRIKKVLTEKKILSTNKYKQEKIDIKSIRLSHNSKINYMSLPINLIKFNSILNRFINSASMTDLLNVADLIFRSFNFKLNIIDNTKNNPIKVVNNKITWLNNEDKNKLIFISNHSHDIDSIILFYILRCGLIASDSINKTDIGRVIASKCNFLIFKRGVDVNVVDKIKEYLDKMKKIIIYPEGTVGNNETLLRFRTGAFYVGAPICPIVIRWRNYVYDEDIKKMIFKVITQNEINIDIYINDIFYPPFNQEKIDHVRDYMAKVGNLEKSRVSNRSIKAT